MFRKPGEPYPLIRESCQRAGRQPRAGAPERAGCFRWAGGRQRAGSPGWIRRLQRVESPKWIRRLLRVGRIRWDGHRQQAGSPGRIRHLHRTRPIQWTFILFMAVLLLQPPTPLAAQDFFKNSTHYNPGRVNGVVFAEAALGTAVTIGLNYLWYKKFPRSPFHFFNDNNEWLNMDKMGHATTAYNIAAIQSDLLQWGGVKRGGAALFGTLTALGFMSMIELMDGHSTKWGFSKGDMLANLAGCLLFEGQQLLWGQQRISLKYSYHHTLFAHYQPNELGDNLPQRMLKDYNGQTYWLSVNIGSFLPGSSGFPKWLNLSAGYGAEGMIGGVKNPTEINGKPIPAYKRYRQFYFGLDTDLYRAGGLSPLSTTLLKLNRTIKMPAPTIEWNEVDGTKWHWLYF